MRLTHLVLEYNRKNGPSRDSAEKAQKSRSLRRPGTGHPRLLSRVFPLAGRVAGLARLERDSSLDRNRIFWYSLLHEIWAVCQAG